MTVKARTVFQILGTPEMIYPNTDDFGWRDITGQVLVRGVAATDPSWSQIGASPFSAYKFAVDDFVWFIYHIPHDIVPNAPVFFHAHWLSDGTSTAEVTWEWTYMYARGFNQDNFNVNGTVVTASQAAPGSAYRHMVTETDGVSIANLNEPDGIIYARLRRVTNTSSPVADNADGIFLLTADVHYQTTDAATIGKAPNFYRG